MRDRFEPMNRHALWKDVPSVDWNSWTWQQQNRVRTVEELEKLFVLSESERSAVAATLDEFRMAITPYYASLIDPMREDCPIRMQAVPVAKEMEVLPSEYVDPLGEDPRMPVPGLIHKYPDRALLYATHHCPVYCRHCTRKRIVSNPETAPPWSQLQAAFDYIRRTPEIRDVLVSGGDPLSLSDERLEAIFRELRSIPHVEILRLSTRNLVTLPQRVTPNLVRRLRPYLPIYVQTHFNHPRECTQEAYDAAALFADAGFVINNQMVLLKDLNDRVEIVQDLNFKLLQMRIQPYYIHHCDMAQGIGHFRTKIDDGIALLEKLRGWNSGLAIPHYVVDLSPGGGKVALVPNYVEHREGGQWTFRNYRGEKYHLEEPAEASRLTPVE